MKIILACNQKHKDSIFLIVINVKHTIYNANKSLSIDLILSFKSITLKEMDELDRKKHDVPSQRMTNERSWK